MRLSGPRARARSKKRATESKRSAKTADEEEGGGARRDRAREKELTAELKAATTKRNARKWRSREQIREFPTRHWTMSDVSSSELQSDAKRRGTSSSDDTEDSE
jgi:hypothetical protein